MNTWSPLETVGDVIEFSSIVSAIIIFVMAIVLWVVLSTIKHFDFKKKHRRGIIFGWFGMVIVLIGIVWQQSFQTMHENHHIRKMERIIQRMQPHHKHHEDY